VSAWCCAQDTGDAVEDDAEENSQDPDATPGGATEKETSAGEKGVSRRKRLTSEECEQRRIDAILHKLFFSSKNQLISEGISYDGSVRYVSYLCAPIVRNCRTEPQNARQFTHMLYFTLRVQFDQ
jgi:hypothetical protein